MLEEFDGAFAGHVVAILVQDFPVFIGVERPVFRYIGKYAQDGAEPFLFKTVKDGKHGGMIFPVFCRVQVRLSRPFPVSPLRMRFLMYLATSFCLMSGVGASRMTCLPIARSSEINARREFE